MPNETDLLLARLKASGLSVPAPGEAKVDLNLQRKDHAHVADWIRGLPSDGGRAWLGVGPGTKMPSKCWPEERFREVVTRLIAHFDIWPVVFGGPEDRGVGERLVACWGRGFVAAGELGLRPSASALSRCVLHLGNDTGTMHLAAAVGVPCVAIYSSRSQAGWWYPYGEGHCIHRTPIACEGCELVECIERGMECILSIEAATVTESCIAVLNQRLPKIR